MFLEKQRVKWTTAFIRVSRCLLFTLKFPSYAACQYLILRVGRHTFKSVSKTLACGAKPNKRERDRQTLYESTNVFSLHWWQFSQTKTKKQQFTPILYQWREFSKVYRTIFIFYCTGIVKTRNKVVVSFHLAISRIWHFVLFTW